METFKTKTIIKKNHKIELKGVPFKDGEKVEVVISSEEQDFTKEYSLRGTLLKYHDPFEPVAEEDWDVLK